MQKIVSNLRVRLQILNTHNFRSQFRSIFRTSSNIQYGGFYKNCERLFVFDHFHQKLRFWYLTRFWTHLWTQERLAGKASISDVYQGLEFTITLIIFERLLPICLLNLINIFHFMSSNTVLCMAKSTWP